MKFCQFSPDLRDTNKIIVDGNKCGMGLQLSHWPGNTTPREFKADLSVDIVLRFLAAREFRTRSHDFDLVTNDHYDTDGLLAIWALLNPSESLDHAAALISAAEAGDFNEFTSPEAVQFDLIVGAFVSQEKSPVAAQIAALSDAQRWQIATEALLSEMPRLLYEPQRYRYLWEEGYRKFLETITRIRSGYVEVYESPAQYFSVISSPFPLDHFTRNVAARGHRILETIGTHDGNTYELYYREFLWYDIVVRSCTSKHLLLHAAETLNDLEPNGTTGSWGVTRWSPALRFVASGPRATRIVKYDEPLGYSGLPLETVERVILTELELLDHQVSLRAADQR
ncbi:MAG TPA: DUF6687 family protein [Candidatus Acidoferrales bacterium]|nr:DUF6687 family protein [Candidatus Acidoferrales bacterium]